MITLVIVTAGRPKQLRETLSSVAGLQPPPQTIIIVDDSDDNSNRENIDSLRDGLKNTRIIYEHRSDGSGMADARNYAISLVETPIVAFIDDDVRLASDYINNLKQAWRTYPDAGAIGGPAIVVNENGEPVHDIRHDQASLNWINQYGEQDSEANRWVPPEPIEVDQLIGANMSFRRSHLIEIGGFDPSYPGPEIYEDTDVMVRLQDRSLPIIYDPSVRIDHHTTRGGNQYWYWFARCCIHFRYRRFRSTFRESIIRLLTNDTGEYLAAWKQLGSVLLRRKGTPLWIWRGWFTGLSDVIAGNADPKLADFDE